MKKLSLKGFTLIEMLIVIGILGVLAVALLLTLNPAEAQKKTRDTKRMRDLSTLQTIIDQAVNDQKATGSITSASGITSNGTVAGNQSCDSSNWLGFNVCNYAQSVPVDPAEGNSRIVVTGTSGTTTATMRYKAIVNGSDYEINVRQESESGRANLNNDGGSSGEWAEAGSKTTLLSN